MHLVPRQSQPIRHGLLAGRLQPVDRQTLEQRREAAVRFGPGQTHHAHPMFGTTAARRLGVQDGAVLAGVQMPPTTARCRGRTKGTPPRTPDTSTNLRLVPQVHMDLPFLQLQFHALHSPRSRNSQNLLIQLMVLHGVFLHPKKHHAIRLTARRQMSKMTFARRNGVGLCWEATRQGIPESRMCQRHRCPGSPCSQGTLVSSPSTPLDIRAMPQKIPGSGAEPATPSHFLHPKVGIPIKIGGQPKVRRNPIRGNEDEAAFLGRRT